MALRTRNMVDDAGADILNAIEQVSTIALASGTLSPLDSFRCELGQDFNHGMFRSAEMEGRHVIDMNKQLARVVTTAPNGRRS